jgi:hypothetical protein
VVALILVGILVAAIAASCTNDEPQAKAILASADASAKTLAADLLKLDSDIETMCANLVAGFDTEPVGVAEDCKEFTDRIQKLSAAADSAKAQYAKISSLKVPGSYKDYARFMTQAIDTLPTVKDQLDQTVNNIVTTSDSENGPDTRQLESAKRTLEQIDEKLRYVEGQAQEARKSAGLTGK